MTAAHVLERLADSVRAGAIEATAAMLATDVTLEIQPEGVELMGRAEVLAVLARWNQAVPDGAIEIDIELTGGSGRVAALTLRGSAVEDRGTQSAPALCWIELTGERIARVVLHHGWGGRQPAIAGDAFDAIELAAAAEPDTSHSQAWYLDLLSRFAEAWSWDPVLGVRSICSPHCVVTVAGLSRHGRAAQDATTVGIGPLEALEARALTAGGRPTRSLRIHHIVGDGALLAARFDVLAAHDPTRRTTTTIETPLAVGSFIARLDVRDHIDRLLLFGPAGPGIPAGPSAPDS